jgi:hypothetical protein
VQVLKKQKRGAAGEWEEWTGTEVVAVEAATLADGQPVQVAGR